MSSNDKPVEKNKTGDDILKMLKKAGVSTASLVDKSHAFWDTQVIGASFPLVLRSISANKHFTLISFSTIHPNFAFSS